MVLEDMLEDLYELGLSLSVGDNCCRKAHRPKKENYASAQDTNEGRIEYVTQRSETNEIEFRRTTVENGEKKVIKVRVTEKTEYAPKNKKDVKQRKKTTKA
jgi:hypothetical protein